MAENPTFKHFFLRSWIWSLIIDIILLCLSVYFYQRFVALQGNHTLFMINLAALIVAGVHALLLFIFAIRRWMRKQGMYGLIFFVHCLLTSLLAYNLTYTWLWGLLSAHK